MCRLLPHVLQFFLKVNFSQLSHYSNIARYVTSLSVVFCMSMCFCCPVWKKLSWPVNHCIGRKFLKTQYQFIYACSFLTWAPSLPCSASSTPRQLNPVGLSFGFRVPVSFIWYVGSIDCPRFWPRWALENQFQPERSLLSFNGTFLFW